MKKHGNINKPVDAKQPAFAPAMFIDYRAEQNMFGALVM
jgi:hypothetical protein